MEIAKCPHCHVRVLPNSDGMCPSCRKGFDEPVVHKIAKCPHCHVRVQPNSDWMCPSCRKGFDEPVVHKTVRHVFGWARFVAVALFLAGTFSLSYVGRVVWVATQLGERDDWRGVAIPVGVGLILWFAGALVVGSRKWRGIVGLWSMLLGIVEVLGAILLFVYHEPSVRGAFGMVSDAVLWHTRRDLPFALNIFLTFMSPRAMTRGVEGYLAAGGYVLCAIIAFFVGAHLIDKQNTQNDECRNL
jgi:hypothetical protein